jgi:carboxyl-terminal processing protease
MIVLEQFSRFFTFLEVHPMKELLKYPMRVAFGALTLLAASTSQAQSTVTVVEYYNSVTGSYFLTGRANEQFALDNDPVWTPSFQRTGMTFVTRTADASSGAPDKLCRYRIQLGGAGWSSHFYGVTRYCDAIKSLALPGFFDEGVDFGVAEPTAGGVCPAEFPVPIYQSFRRLTPVDVPNHRYSVSVANYNEMTTRGWVPEGPVFCVLSATPATPRPTFAAASSNANQCVAPRIGSSPYTGQPYPDQPGTVDNERNWMRSWIDETYLWYREIPNVVPASYPTAQSLFPVLKTPLSTYVGIAKDQFHFSESTDSFERSRSGTTFGYGIRWAIASSRVWRAGVVDPGTPAALAGVVRGDEIVSINGVSMATGSSNALNAGLFPSQVGQNTSFQFRSPNGAIKNVNLRSASLQSQTVSDVGTISTPNGKVGYLAFHTFSPFVSESQLIGAFTSLSNAGVNDLVLDLRYNGGGLISVSSQLAYMIAGAARTSGRVYERTRTNDKFPFGTDLDVPFYASSLGFSVAAGQPLPTLNLGRVYILTSDDSCSASEALINGLRGVDVDVKLVGNTTCGKPYGFIPTSNCGTTYYAIQFDGVNGRGEGDYITGFAASCAANDDLGKPLGDPTEKQLAAALHLRSTGSCLASASSESKAVQTDRRRDDLLSSSDPDIGSRNKLFGVPPPATTLPKAVDPSPLRDLGHTN